MWAFNFCSSFYLRVNSLKKRFGWEWDKECVNVGAVSQIMEVWNWRLNGIWHLLGINCRLGNCRAIKLSSSVVWTFPKLSHTTLTLEWRNGSYILLWQRSFFHVGEETWSKLRRHTCRIFCLAWLPRFENKTII